MMIMLSLAKLGLQSITREFCMFCVGMRMGL